MYLFAPLLALLGTALRGLAHAYFKLAWDVYRVPVVLGAAIVALTGGGLGLIIASHAMTGWGQSTLLGFGTGLVLTGTLEIGLIVGLINRIIEPDGQAWKPSQPELVLKDDGKTWTVVRPASPRPTPHEVALRLRELASSLERGLDSVPAGTSRLAQQRGTATPARYGCPGQASAGVLCCAVRPRAGPCR